jgi:hypothetical protein
VAGLIPAGHALLMEYWIEVDAAVGERSVAVVRTAVRGHYDFMKSYPASLPKRGFTSPKA